MGAVRLLGLCVAWAVIVSVRASSAAAGRSVHFHRICVEMGDNLGPHVQKRLWKLLGMVVGLTERHQARLCGEVLYDSGPGDAGGPTNVLLLSLGNASTSSALIPPYELSVLPKESFRIVAHVNLSVGMHTYVLATNGLPLDDHVHKNVSFDRYAVHYGAVVGAYAALERLGFSFLHPLQPYVPPILRLSLQVDGVLAVNATESPYWPERGFHIHTQHPLEVTEVLQGHDIPQFGPHGMHCRRFSKRHASDDDDGAAGQEAGPDGYCERWEDMVADVDYFFEWAVANRLNKVEWLLLNNYKWGDELSVRHDRLRKLTTLGHQYSLLVGADVPLGNIQQHGWYIVNVRLPLSEQVQQIRDRVDWVFHAGFDFLTTESGMSEFTHPECGLMVDLMNAFATYVNGTWGREAAIKVHCSTGQTCEDFLDPRTGDPANFNFLPTFTHPSLGVFPHTVQFYALDDPTGGSYGNANFSYIEEYLVFEAKAGRRSVSFYGETSYWVNVDIDVPLFLPLYGQRRQRDLRRLAARERAEGFRMHGQMNFDSGWEWGYWINDVVTARASWDPMMDTVASGDEDVCASPAAGGAATPPSQDQLHDAHPTDSLHDLDQWRVFGDSLRPITDIFGPHLGTELNRLLVDLSRRQAELLVFGIVGGQHPSDLKKLSGIAYLSGTDTWVDLPRKFGLAFTQPDKVHMKESSDPRWPQVMALLAEMEETFRGFSERADQILNLAEQSVVEAQRPGLGQAPGESDADAFVLNDQALQLLHELRDCIRMLHLRARQTHKLYASRDLQLVGDEPAQRALHVEARQVLQEAGEIVATREQAYRVPWQRVAGWRENPTVYRYGYLWAVRTLYYWWRDQGLAEQVSSQSEHSPCYLNRMDSTEVAVGWGKYTLELLRIFINRYTPFHSFYPLEVFNCLSPPPREYSFPRDLTTVRH